MNIMIGCIQRKLTQISLNLVRLTNNIDAEINAVNNKLK